MTREKDKRKERLSGWLEENFSAQSEGAKSRMAWSEEHTEALRQYFEKFWVWPDKHRS